MKCPKCGYLGYERVERCRNCGYEFALTTPPVPPDLRIREGASVPSPLEDLELLDSVSRTNPSRPRTDEPALETHEDQTSGLTELPLFGPPITDDVPLITKASRPRPPLAVRRATPEVPRVRSDARTPLLEWGTDTGAPPPAAGSTPPAVADYRAEPSVEYRTTRREVRAAVANATVAPPPASLAARALAMAIDLVVLAAIDVVAVYFTLKICGIGADQWAIVPKIPLTVFLLVQNGGYLVAFTVAGQTIGKLVAGVRVLSDDANAAPDLGRAVVRTILWTVLALPAGLGLLTAVFDRDRRGLHDRFAGTRVVRAGA